MYDLPRLPSRRDWQALCGRSISVVSCEQMLSIANKYMSSCAELARVDASSMCTGCEAMTFCNAGDLLFPEGQLRGLGESQWQVITGSLS